MGEDGAELRAVGPEVAPLEHAAPPARSRLAAVLAWWPTALFVLLGLGVVAWVGRGLFVMQLSVYDPRSDFWEHAGVLRALMDSPLSPRNPHLDTADPSPRFMPLYVLVAIAARLSGYSALQGMALAGSVNVALLVAGVFAFFQAYFRDRRAPLYALVVVLGSWYHGFRFSNVYQLYLLFEIAAYPSTAAVGFTFLTFAITVRALRGRPSFLWLALVALSTANVVLTHALTATMAFTGVLAMAWFEPEIGRRRRWSVIAAALSSCGLVELWPYFSTVRTVLNGQEIDTSWVVDGLEDLVERDFRRWHHQFYDLFPLARTVGFAALGGYALACFAVTGRHRFVLAGALAMLGPFILNTFVKLPLGHRFVLLFIGYLQIGLVWLLLKLTPGYREAWWWIRGRRWRRVGARLCVAGLLGLMATINVQKARKVKAPSPTSQRNLGSYCRAVAAGASAKAVVMADPVSSWPLPACGVKVVALLHQNPLVPDQRERSDAVRAFMSPEASDRRREAILEEYRVTHVLTHRRSPKSLVKFLQKRASRRSLPGGYVLHTLTK
ncbi:MAG TPA: hypothetical protein PLU22_02040 [Polyangiaceae bacterium]|nr:hypothetical protein [Polyangiaceae bacterium]